MEGRGEREREVIGRLGMRESYEKTMEEMGLWIWGMGISGEDVQVVECIYKAGDGRSMR